MGPSVAVRAGARALDIEILIESPLWDAQPGAAETVRRALAAAGAATSVPEAEVAVVLDDDAAIRALNRQWRGIDKPTNVLSFPAAPNQPGAPRALGDIVIAYETVAREAAAEDKPFEHHLAHLAVHGFLHLLGYDHEADTEAEAMEHVEGAILVGLGIPDPYEM